MVDADSASSARVEKLRNVSLSFVRSFGAGLSGPECLDKFFTSSPKIIEHGPHFANERLPFLAITFNGRRHQGQPKAETCDDYYDLLTSTLALVPGTVRIPSKQDIGVDPDRGIVTVRLHAKFKSKKTGKAWVSKMLQIPGTPESSSSALRCSDAADFAQEEDFVYVLREFDENYKIGYQELWADPLSAWLAVGDPS